MFVECSGRKSRAFTFKGLLVSYFQKFTMFQFFGRSQLLCSHKASGIFYYLRTQCALHYFIYYATTALCKYLITCSVMQMTKNCSYAFALKVKHLYSYIHNNQITFSLHMCKNINRQFNSHTKRKAYSCLAVSTGHTALQLKHCTCSTEPRSYLLSRTVSFTWMWHFAFDKTAVLQDAQVSQCDVLLSTLSRFPRMHLSHQLAVTAQLQVLK